MDTAQEIKLNPQPQRENQAMRILTTPSVLTVHAQILTDLVPLYLIDCQRRGARRKTITNYAYQLEPFRRWWKEVGPPAFELTQTKLSDYPRWLRDVPIDENGRTFSQNSLHTYARRARQFLRWLHTTGRLPRDISPWLPIPTKPTRMTRSLTSDELTRILLACQGSTRVRDITMVAFLVETAARRFEAAAACWEHITFTGQWRGYVWLEIVKGRLDLDKRRYVCFGETTGKLLHLWQFYINRTEGPIFGLTNSGIGAVCHTLSQRSGVEFGAHDFRRTFATYWIRHCAPPNRDVAERLLEMQLGHSGHTMTQQHYLALTHSDVLDVYVSPFDDIDLPGLRFGGK